MWELCCCLDSLISYSYIITSRSYVAAVDSRYLNNLLYMHKWNVGSCSSQLVCRATNRHSTCTCCSNFARLHAPHSLEYICARLGLDHDATCVYTRVGYRVALRTVKLSHVHVLVITRIRFIDWDQCSVSDWIRVKFASWCIIWWWW